MRERIHKPSFQPIPSINKETSLSKKKEILPTQRKPSLQEESETRQLTAEEIAAQKENSEYIILQSVAKHNSLNPDEQERLNYLQTKRDRVFTKELKLAIGLGHSPSKIDTSYSRPAIQPKLTIGKPNDREEQEADRVAEQVMNVPQPLQKLEQPEEEEIMQPKPLVLRQLDDTPDEDDEFEIMQLKPLIQRNQESMSVEDEEEEILQPKPILRRNQESMSVEDEKEEILQPKPILRRSNKVDTEDLENKLNNTSGGGFPLPESTLGFMESRFGADFSDVRVHTDSTAVDMNQSIQAQAFTQGQDIYFNSGKYSPDSNEGKSLLAHELTHVLQQRGDDIAAKETLESQKTAEESLIAANKQEGKEKLDPVVIKFKKRVISIAISRLNENQQDLERLSGQYTDGEQSKELLYRLRTSVKLDAKLASKQEKLELELKTSTDSGISPGLAAMGLSVRVVDSDRLNELSRQIEEIKVVRKTLLEANPISGLLNSNLVKDSASDAELKKTLLEQFNKISSAIEQAKSAIVSEDAPLEELQPIIDVVLAEFPSEKDRAIINKYIENQKNAAKAVELVGTLGTIGLTLGAILAGIATGGGTVIPTIFAALGTGLGGATAVYQLERADDLNTIAKTGDAGGNQLLSDAAKAKQDFDTLTAEAREILFQHC